MLPVVLKQPFQPIVTEIDGVKRKQERVKMTDFEKGKQRNERLVNLFKDILE